MFGLLIMQLEEDDRAFMLNLYKNYYNLVRKTVFSLTHDNQDIEDLTSDVFVKLIDKISLIRSFDCCKTTAYVVYTSRSVAINYIKHKQVEKKHMYYSDKIDFIEDLVERKEDSEERFIRQEETELLACAVSRLPQNQKDLLYFKYILDMSDKEISEILGIAQDSVRQYLTRARRNAKKLMEKEVEDRAV